MLARSLCPPWLDWLRLRQWPGAHIASQCLHVHFHFPVPELRKSPSWLQVDQQWREMMESASKQPNCIIIAADKERLTGNLLQCATSQCAAAVPQTSRAA